MNGMLEQLNLGLLLLHTVHGGPPPHTYRKAWRSLLTLSSNLQGVLSDTLQCKLEAALHAMLDIDKRDFTQAANSLEDLADNVAAQSDNQIPQADADALLAAVRQLQQISLLAHY